MSRRPALANPAVVEAYIRAGVIPRFMERLREIEDELAVHRRRLRLVYDDLRESCDGDRQQFERRWRAVAHRWHFDDVNELIEQHNAYYPMERNLPLDPRTGDYVTVSGRPWQREPAGPEWILARFPP